MYDTVHLPSFVKRRFMFSCWDCGYTSRYKPSPHCPQCTRIARRVALPRGMRRLWGWVRRAWR